MEDNHEAHVEDNQDVADILEADTQHVPDTLHVPVDVHPDVLQDEHRDAHRDVQRGVQQHAIHQMDDPLDDRATVVTTHAEVASYYHDQRVHHDQEE